jgi:hypothetical protein
MQLQKGLLKQPSWRDGSFAKEKYRIGESLQLAGPKKLSNSLESAGGSPRHVLESIAYMHAKYQQFPPSVSHQTPAAALPTRQGCLFENHAD